MNKETELSELCMYSLPQYPTYDFVAFVCSQDQIYCIQYYILYSIEYAYTM
jgi:hypothetical protein